MAERTIDGADQYLADKLARDMAALGDASKLEYIVMVRAGNWFCCEETMLPASSFVTLKAILKEKKIPWYVRLFLIF